MNILGISAGFHDAAAAVINQHGDILFAGHSERYSKKKNDADINLELVQEIVQWPIDHVAYYERPWLKQLRSLRAGQGIDWSSITLGQVLKKQLPGMKHIPSTSTHNHHLCHAAAGFQTSPYDRATVVVIDAIGEFDTISIWGAEYDKKGQAKYTRLWGQKYPHSIGLFYSAITQRVGLHPLDEEYITMGMSAWGRPHWYQTMHNNLIDDDAEVRFRENLHLGIDPNYLSFASNEEDRKSVV